MMEKVGEVVKSDASYVEVKIKRMSACGENCQACGACPQNETIVKAKNKAGAKEGDTVRILMSEKKLFLVCFLVYILPLVAMILGYFLTFYFTKNEGASIIVAFGAILVGFFALFVFDKMIKDKYTPVADSVVNKK